MAETKPIVVTMQFDLYPPMADVLALLLVQCLKSIVRCQEKAGCLAGFTTVFILGKLN
jgi:hypothetical protein